MNCFGKVDVLGIRLFREESGYCYTVIKKTKHFTLGSSDQLPSGLVPRRD